MIKFSKEILDLAISRLPAKRGPIKVLCSSGVDSIAISHFFHKKVSKDYGYWNIFHFNHQQRPQNDLMEESYSKFGYDLDIPRFEAIKLIDRGYCGNESKPTEDSLRQARLEYIKNNHYHNILITAHHLDDATESYMMNVLRGKEGFLPIPFITKVGTNLLIHPFLFTKKADFQEYVKRNDLTKYVVEDETNKVTKGSRRNFIRNEIMPLLQREKMGLSTIVEKKMKERLMLELIKG